MKKYSIILAFFLSLSLHQTLSAQTIEIEEPTDTICADSIMAAAEVMPEFPGGMKKLFEFLNHNIQYPQEAILYNIHGKVFVDFVIDKFGNTKNITVKKGVHPLLNEEAMRVFHLMPKWSPGLISGQSVNVRMTVPVTFALTKEQLSKKQQKQILANSQVPEFPGGEDALKAYIKENITYPQFAYNNNIQGEIWVRCLIDEFGSVIQTEILNSPSPKYIIKNNEAIDLIYLLEIEAQKILRSMPKWKPGRIEGGLTKMYCTIPVAFTIPEEEIPNLPMSDTIYNDVKEVTFPEYPGGIDTLLAYLSENIKYPSEAQEENIQGRVIATFIIEKDGSISSPIIKKGVHYALDKEALRVIQNMPKWKPGTLKGFPIRVKYTTPITFRLGSK